jgi:hypothetical protein
MSNIVTESESGLEQEFYRKLFPRAFRKAAPVLLARVVVLR